jgi:hypothetical protein
MYVYPCTCRLSRAGQGDVMGKRAASTTCLRQGFKGHEIEEKHGEVPIRIFRIIYGSGFAPAFCASHSLRHTLAILDRPSLDKLLTDERCGVLDAKIAAAVAEDIPEQSAVAGDFVLRRSP